MFFYYLNFSINEMNMMVCFYLAQVHSSAMPEKCPADSSVTYLLPVVCAVQKVGISFSHVPSQFK